MKIAFILGRNVEGCGVTMCTLQNQNWLRANGHEVTTYALDDKRWGRRKGIPNDFVEVKVDNAKLIVSKLNECDFVIYNSLPSKKHSDKAKDTFTNYWIKEITATKVLAQFDHKRQSLSRNHDIIGTCTLMDAFFSHSLTSDFSNLVKGLAPIYKMGLGVDYTALETFRKPQERLIKKATYFSRVASFKDPQRMLDLFPMLSKEGIITELNGIERSMSSLGLLMDENRKIKPEINDFSNGKVDKNTMEIRGTDLNQAYVFGPYQRDLGLECQSYSMFGADFYNLKPHMYGDNFENAMCEIIGCGSIPLFDAHFAENCKLRGTNTYFKDIENFAVFSDRSNLQGTVDQMVEIANSPELIRKYRQTGLNVAIEHSDINNVMKDIVRDLEKIKKKTDYKEPIQELVEKPKERQQLDLF